MTLHPISSIFLDSALLDNSAKNNGNNIFNFVFTGDVKTTNDSRISVVNFSVPFSWFNITAAYKNNVFKYVWFDKSTVSVDFPAPHGGEIFTVTIPDGYYDLPTLNSYLQYAMIQNGHVLVDSSGNYVYYLDLQYNISTYDIEVNAYQLPNDLPAGWSKPTGCTIDFKADGGANDDDFYMPKIFLYLQDSLTDPTTVSTATKQTNMFIWFGFNPRVNATLLSDIGIKGRLIPNGTPNPATTSFQHEASDLAPKPLPVHSVCLVCDGMVDNKIRSNALHNVSTFVVSTFDATSTTFGTNIKTGTAEFTWMPLAKNTTIANRQLTFKLTDQDGDLILLQDPDVNIELLITNLIYG